MLAFSQGGKAQTGNNNKYISTNIAFSIGYSVAVQNIGTLTTTGFWQISDKSTTRFKVNNTFAGDGISWDWIAVGK